MFYSACILKRNIKRMDTLIENNKANVNAVAGSEKQPLLFLALQQHKDCTVVLHLLLEIVLELVGILADSMRDIPSADLRVFQCFVTDLSL
jgi:hypothetical protein